MNRTTSIAPRRGARALNALGRVARSALARVARVALPAIGLAAPLAPTAGALAQPAATVAPAAPLATAPRELKVVIVSMFEPEAAPWVEPFKLTEKIAVPGLLAEAPALRCNADDVCLLLAGMGHANVAASTMALALDPRFDLRRAYFLIAGIDPARGTTLRQRAAHLGGAGEGGVLIAARGTARVTAASREAPATSAR